MVVAEPRLLAEVGTLAGHLEVQPLENLILLWGRIVGKRVALVVGLDYVLEDCPGLHRPALAVRQFFRRECGAHLAENDASVRIFNSWYTAIWVEANVWLILEIRKLHELGFVRQTELLKQNRNLPRVRPLHVK